MNIMKKAIWLLIFLQLLSSCATARKMSSPHYLPEWQNRFFTFPNPSETTGGYWAVKAASATGKGIAHLLLFPLALAGNLVVNTYYIVTWPVRWPLRGDKRLLVWYPLFARGDKVGSRYFSREWNEDLS